MAIIQDSITGCRAGLGFAAAPGVGSIKVIISDSATVSGEHVAVIIDWATVGRCLYEAAIRDDGTLNRQVMSDAMHQIIAGAAASEQAQ